MKNILIDLSANKSGGGAQRALNFVYQLENTSLKYQFYVIRPKGYFLQIDKMSIIKRVIETPENYILRFLFENFKLKNILRALEIDLCITFAGTGLPLPKNIPSIVGVAYPIICYDDSPYWKHLRWTEFYRLKLKNYFRKRRLKGADEILAQTTIMRERLSKSLNRDIRDIKIFPPSPSNFINKAEHIGVGNINILLLSGNSHHKNLWRLYEVAEELSKNKFDCKFLITVNKTEWVKSLKEKVIDKALVDKYFSFLGKINSDEIQKVYNESSVVLNISDLESFSNNYMEAWKAEIPLILSDRDFARNICADSAIYVEPHRPKEISEGIIKLISQPEIQKELILKGKRRLAELPQQSEYFDKLLSLIENYD